jgi:hypothetical protein
VWGGKGKRNITVCFLRTFVVFLAREIAEAKAASDPDRDESIGNDPG